MTGIVRFVEIELLAHRRVPTAEQMDKLADALAAIEYYLEATREQRGNRERILDVTRESLEGLGYWPVPPPMGNELEAQARVRPVDARAVAQDASVDIDFEPATPSFEATDAGIDLPRADLASEISAALGDATPSIDVLPGDDIGRSDRRRAQRAEPLAHDLAGLRLAETGERDDDGGWTEIEEEIEEEVPSRRSARLPVSKVRPAKTSTTRSARCSSRKWRRKSRTCAASCRCGSATSESRGTEADAAIVPYAERFGPPGRRADARRIQLESRGHAEPRARSHDRARTRGGRAGRTCRRRACRYCSLHCAASARRMADIARHHGHGRSRRCRRRSLVAGTAAATRTVRSTVRRRVPVCRELKRPRIRRRNLATESSSRSRFRRRTGNCVAGPPPNIDPVLVRHPEERSRRASRRDRRLSRSLRPGRRSSRASAAARGAYAQRCDRDGRHSRARQVLAPLEGYIKRLRGVGCGAR